MRHIVWDWNGCLFDDHHIVVEAVNDALAGIGVPRITAADYRRLYTRPLPAFYARLLGRAVDPDEWPALDAAYHRAYLARLDRAGLAAGARAALRATARAGATQSLLSMWHHDALVDLVGRLGLTGHFARVDGLQGVGGGSKHPHLEVHLAALAGDGLPGLEPEAVVVIGDALDDAAAARAVGARAVLVDGGSHQRDRLEAAGVPVADTPLDALALAGVVGEGGGAC